MPEPVIAVLAVLIAANEVMAFVRNLWELGAWGRNTRQRAGSEEHSVDSREDDDNPNEPLND
jgi:hypothetical protein